MRGVLHEFLGTWPGRTVCMALLLPVLVLGELFAAGHTATSVHITATTLDCTNCTAPPGEVVFNEAFTDSSFVQSLQGTMNTAPVPPPIMHCALGDHYNYTFTFMTVGNRVVQSYAGTLTCVDDKATLDVPAVGLVNSFPYVSFGVELGVVRYQGQPLLEALHHDIGLPVTPGL